MNHLDARWKESADAYIRWHRATGRWAKRDSGDDREVSLQSWLNVQRGNARISDKRRRYLDKHLPGWSSNRRPRPHPSWEGRFQAAVYWVNHNGRRPTQTGTTKELAAYRWLFMQARRLPLDDARRDRLVEALDGWDHIHGWWPPATIAQKQQHAWRAAFDRHVGWVTTNGCRPSPRRSPEERSAYLWFYKAAHNLAENDPRRGELVSAIPGWDHSTGWW